MKLINKNIWFMIVATMLLTVSCSTSQKTVEIAGKKVPVKVFTNEQIQADAWVLSYMTCKNELLKYKLDIDSLNTNANLKNKLKKDEIKRKLFFNRMFVRYFQDSTYKNKFLNYQKEGEKLFRPCQQINALKIMQKMSKK